MLNKIQELKELNKKEKILWLLFLDFTKAYDMVNHEILFEKMRKIDIKEEII